MTDRRVIHFSAVWFVINLVFGLASVPLGISAAAVAWEAHAGGFIAGFLLFRLFDPPPLDPAHFEAWMAPQYRAREDGPA